MVKSITIKDTHIAELTEVFGEDYTTEIWDNTTRNMIPNPQTKAQYASTQFDSQWKQFIINKVQDYRRKTAVISTDSIIE